MRILHALDSWHCTTAPDAAHRRTDELLGLYRTALEALRWWDAFGSVYWDPRVATTPAYVAVLDAIAGDPIPKATYAEIAAARREVS